MKVYFTKEEADRRIINHLYDIEDSINGCKEHIKWIIDKKMPTYGCDPFEKLYELESNHTTCLRVLDSYKLPDDGLISLEDAKELHLI